MVPKLVPSKHENAPESPNPDVDRLAVIADLLTELSADQREEVIAELEAAERAAITRLLISKGSSERER